MSARSLEDAIAGAGSPVELARNSQIGPYVYPAVPAEFSNWREEQVAWRETAALFDQSHHMTDLYIEGPDVIRLLSELGINTFANAAVDKAKQFVAVNPDGYVIGDAILFFLDENRVSLVGRPSAHNSTRSLTAHTSRARRRTARRARCSSSTRPPTVIICQRSRNSPGVRQTQSTSSSARTRG